MTLDGRGAALPRADHAERLASELGGLADELSDLAHRAAPDSAAAGPAAWRYIGAARVERETARLVLGELAGRPDVVSALQGAGLGDAPLIVSLHARQRTLADTEAGWALARSLSTRSPTMSTTRRPTPSARSPFKPARSASMTGPG